MVDMTSTTSTIDYRAMQGPMTDRLAALGRSLSSEQWTSPSLCDGWRVCDVFGHMAYGGVTPMRTVLPVLLFRYRGNLNRGSAVESVRYADTHPQHELIDEFVRSSHHPVGIGKLVKAPELHMDHIVHELDVRRPLGLASQWNDDDLRAALEAAVTTKTPLIAPAKTAAGLRFVATDIAWSAGAPDAPEVRGPAEDLLLALTGRKVGLAALSGAGVAELASRIS